MPALVLDSARIHVTNAVADPIQPSDDSDPIPTPRTVTNDLLVDLADNLTTSRPGVHIPGSTPITTPLPILTTDPLPFGPIRSSPSPATHPTDRTSQPCSRPLTLIASTSPHDHLFSSRQLPAGREGQQCCG